LSVRLRACDWSARSGGQATGLDRAARSAGQHSSQKRA